MISVVMRTLNEGEEIGKCLKILFEQEIDDKIEVVIIDSDSNDRTREIASQFKNVKIFNLGNKSFSSGGFINYGIERAKGDIIVVLSAHAIPCNYKWLKKLVEPLEDDLSHYAVSPLPIRSILRHSARRKTNMRWQPGSIQAGRQPSAVPRRIHRRGSAPM